MNATPAFSRLSRASALLAVTLLGSTLAAANESDRPILVITSSNDATTNSVLVFELQHGSTSALPLVQSLPTRGAGGASGDAGIVQFRGDSGAVANFGSNSVSRLSRSYDAISVDGAIPLAAGCQHPDSVALAHDHLYVTGANCAESHRWPEGTVDAKVVLADNSAAQIAAGRTWAAVTMKSGSVVQLPLAWSGALNGTSNPVALPADADDTPFGAAFWGDLLGFNAAHSADSLALVNRDGDVSPIAGPAPPYPTNAPCWLAKGRGNVWYSGNSPGKAISIFFSDSAGGVFYKSVPLPGVPTDVTVSADGRWLAVIYSAGGAGFVAVFSIDDFGDLTPVATSGATGVAAYSGVAFSQ